MNFKKYFLIVFPVMILLSFPGTETVYAGNPNIDNSTARPSWYDDAIFWVWGASTGDVGEEEGIRSFLTKVRPAAALIGTKHHGGWAYYPTKIGVVRPGPASSGRHQEMWRKMTREMGMGLTITHSGTWDDQAGIAHPEWIRKDPSGKPAGARGIMCLNSGYVDRYFLPMIREITEWYQPDSWWIDGDNWAVRPCFCGRCVEKFENEYGIDAPKFNDEPAMEKFREFHRKDFVRYTKKTADLIHSINPGSLYHTNWGWSFCQPEPAPEWIGYLSADIPTRHRPDEFSLLARYWSTYDKPYDVASAELTQFGYPYPKPLDHLLLEETLTLMNGGKFAIWGGFTSHYKQNTLVKLREFAEERRDIFMNTESYPDAAILHSAGTFYHEGNGFMNFQMQALGRLYGAQKFLSEEHYHFDVMNEIYAQENSSRYNMIFLPEQTRLDEKTLDALRRYVDQGGTLIGTGLTAAEEMPDGTMHFIPEDLFGIRLSGDEPASPAFVEVGDYRLPVRHAFRPIVTTTAQKVIPLYKSYNDRDMTTLDIPAVTVNSFGKGKVLYIGADIFTQYYESQYPGIRRFIADALSHVAGERLIKTNAPSGVEFSLRRRDRDLIVNVCNKTPDRDTRAYEAPFIEKIQDMGPLRTTIKCRRNPQRILFVPDSGERKEISWKWIEGAVRVEIPYLHIHSALILENVL